uniref:cullin-7 n=1 Tax=Euleptes europaea TaxID=460621 RepID=UPI00253FBD86|nr:cullin-7 [Euleptes europaea]
MVSERQNGSVLVHLELKLHAYPEELIRQRCGYNGHTEYLIRWSVFSLENGTGRSTDASPAESKMENVLMWMSADDVYANCPTLLGTRKPEEKPEGKASFPPDVPLDEASFLEMKADVRNLVQRVAEQMVSSTVSQPSILNTIHVLSAYANIGSLIGVFKETGALDLLMKMLCNEEKQIRRSAGKMLRALASHDAGSRAYVLLSLSQQDGIEDQMDFDSCYTLLELFAETTSSEEHCVSFEGIQLPEIPGKLLFSLVKRYLGVTSLMGKLNTTSEPGGEEAGSVPSPANHEGQKRMQCEFDFSVAMGSLISELVQVMGWDRNQELKERRPRVAKSIFQPQVLPNYAIVQSATHLPQKEIRTFKTRSAFPSCSGYVEYVQEKLVCGMRVRMLEDYEKVCAGDEGDFLLSNNGTPPVQVHWESLGHIYWVPWHMIEIISGSGQAEQKALEKVSNLTKTLREDTASVNQRLFHKPLPGLCSLPYLTDRMTEKTGTLNLAEWWELLFFIKKLEPQKQQEIIQFIQQNQKLSQLDEEGLIQLSVSTELAQKVLELLSQQCLGCTQRDLQRCHVYLKYCFFKGQANENYQNGDKIPVESGSLPEAMAPKTSKESPSAEEALPAPSMVEKTDTQLNKELFRLEELSFPETLEEKAKAFCSVKVAGKKSALEQLAEVMEVIQKPSCGVLLQMASLRFITDILEEEPGQQKQLVKAEDELAIREKTVKMLVELLNCRVEKLLIVLVLRMLYVLLAKYDWRIPFATKGGLQAMLCCMLEYPTSALVQQAGLAVLKVLLGVGNYELPGAGGKSNPLNHSDAQMMREIFASIGSASSKDSDNLLFAIPAAVEKMLGTPGASSAVQNGLLALNMLINNHKGLAEQLGNCDLHLVLQNCCRSGQSSNEMLARIVLNRLAEHKLTLSQENADSAASIILKETEVTTLLSSLRESSISKEMVAALECCLCGVAACPEENNYELFTDVLLLRDLTLVASEKDVMLGALKVLDNCLDSPWWDKVPWHDCIEPCLSSMSAHINDRQIVQGFTSFLYCLATLDKDCAVMMCCMGAKEALTKVLEKHSSNVLLVTELRDLVSNCEKYASLYKKMTSSILAGCIQIALGQIEEHRRSHQPITIPLFDVFLHYLCQGCSLEVKDDKCWERVEVSSNPYRASKLVDGNPKTYWESNGSTSSHYINVYLLRGVIVRKMSMLVSSEDSSYMPACIMVMGGESASSISTKLNVVNVPSSASRVTLLENMSCFWPVIQIKIKHCQQGGIDTRVRGIEVLGPKPTFWPIFKEQLCRRTFLFYTTKAHTWCQEILEDRRQLLQLFNRLNSALRHEQEFADRFLPDDEAAQALGKTCWDALITPLVQSITSPDPSGISPLSWLLSQYLENLKAAARAKRPAAIFNSHVRRLSHLLVHVDSSGPEPEELKAPVKANGKNKESSSGAAKPVEKKAGSTTGIMQCWKGVVQQQVKRFLESSWQDPDFVEQYCNIYQRLRTAMEELFGQQMCFMLALRQGFSGGLLQLSFLTAMHVSEQFARYIDVWIQKSWADSGNVETLRRLQWSLEPILFLSGLELANTFEHFYRYYLGDRLLSQGKTWLESAVVEHIGLCFPNRFPQQMLKNLSELEEEQQQFHLFQLQQLDKHLLELDQDGKYKEEEGEVMEEEPHSPEEEPEVKVLALSPRCWTVSPLCYLEEPARFFPPSLSQHLGRFADFYTQSQSRFGLQHTQPRRLQWTWLGHAELCYQDWILHVSTLQMYILLLFNTAEEVPLEKLLQDTGLSLALLAHALKPLVEKEFLMQNQGLLRLNEKMLAQFSGQHLALLPKRAYLNVVQNEGSSLEKRRNFICSLILQILKEEKAMHIDRLVFRVIDDCQKLDSDSAPKFLNYRRSSSTDILSCVLHLLKQGSIQRQDKRPQLLEYISPDLPTPVLPKNQPQVAFQTVQIKKVPSVPCVEKRQTFSTFREELHRSICRFILLLAKADGSFMGGEYKAAPAPSVTNILCKKATQYIGGQEESCEELEYKAVTFLD